MRKGLGFLAVVLVLAGHGLYFALSGGEARLQEGAGVGPTPTIPEPERRLIPTVNIAHAKGWKAPSFTDVR
jgi:hypothetical protein